MNAPALWRRLWPYLLSVLATSALAAGASTQFVLAELGALGVDVPLVDRVAATVHDMIGMFPTYAPIIAVGFLIALWVAALLGRRWPGVRGALFTLAGASAVLAALGAMEWSFGIMPVAGARTAGGLLAQALAGAVGGWLYARLSPSGRPHEN
ncbi:MAG: hypothetical protein R3200_01820 [Xanthomonadales bacterium]|nr:hypothetical protein [Xanthomonadales bacterium]